MKKTIDLIAGARPNFMKIAAFFAEADAFPDLQLQLIHTGQHYDPIMSDIFFQELDIPAPLCHLGVGSGSHACQTSEIMKGYENWIKKHRPDVTLVVGDVNSTVACAMVAAKENIKIAHVEAGLRSNDRSMPEEINRIITDSISDIMYVTELSGVANLIREGHPFDSIYLVGNVMIDTLRRMLPKAEALNACREYGAEEKKYAYVTLHRPSNIDDEQLLNEICEHVHWLSDRISVIFPAHPRTRKRLNLNGWEQKFTSSANVFITEPVGYLRSLSLLQHAKVVITDSGGLQEEATALNVPCLTLRENTERPVTIDKGTNTLIGKDWKLFRDCLERIENNSYLQNVEAIPYWDGNAAKRILTHLSALV